MTVNKERVELLCQALESDQYLQCRGALRRELTTSSLVTDKWSYCAAGVAIEVAIKNGLWLSPFMLEDWYFLRGYLPEEVADWYGFIEKDPEIDLGDTGYSVVSANDGGADFWTISQAIRAGYLKDN